MAQAFTNSAANLQSFFSQAGRGFYIPYYQRNYSWDEENAEKLIHDIFGGVKRVLTKPTNSIFLGTIILHDETQIKTGVHTDTPNLLTKISNVVDGQQRITSIGILAAVMSKTIDDFVQELRACESDFSEFENLAGELENQKQTLRELYSVEIRKNGANPQLKPVIIRAGDVSSQPASDQWTLSGVVENFYRSSTAKFQSDFIKESTLENVDSEDRIGKVVAAFVKQIAAELESADKELANELVSAHNEPGGSLQNFLDWPPNLSKLDELTQQQSSVYCKGLLLLAASYFFHDACSLVIIECEDESIAFDMFQSLNATGTPLTAFEVFKPLIIKTYGRDYATSIKEEVDRIEKVFEVEKTASGKEALTAKVIVSSALAYDGSSLSTKFSDERDWLNKTFPDKACQKTKDFISCIATQAEYCKEIIRPRRANKGSESFPLVNHFTKLGLSLDQADMSALCVYFLKDANHQFAHSVISVFYGKLLDAQSNTSAKAQAVGDFVSICKATAAFFTLWMGALQGRFPDSTYKNLFQAPDNISATTGKANQTATFVKSIFRDALQSEGIYSSEDSNNSRELWVQAAKGIPWYLKKAVCKFALFASSHDAAPDLTVSNEGLYVDGMTNSAPMLSCRAWHSRDYEVIEHVATRDQPSNIEFDAHFDQSIYPGNRSVVDKIGNLTLLSRKINSSLYSEWPGKVFYFWSLTMPQDRVHGPIGDTLKESLGIDHLPPGHEGLTAASVYLHHLAPLSYRGGNGETWDSEFIAQRSEHLCKRVFDKLNQWLI